MHLFFLFKDNWRGDKNWHICNSWYKKGRASDLWLPVWALHNYLVASFNLQYMWHNFMKFCIFIVQSNKFSRFVQFGADQDCHCGAVGCRRKLGVRPTKPKMSSDAALKLVADQVAVSSPKLKAILSGICVYRLASFCNWESPMPLSKIGCSRGLIFLATITN